MTPRFTLIHGDSIEELKKLPPDSIDACVTDPPYGIRFMGKAWDGKDIEEKVDERRRQAQNPSGNAGPHGEHNSPAMQAGRYDRRMSANAAFQRWTEEWGREVYRVLKPGAHIVSFCSTRTYHRMAVGLEDAGFEVRDQLAWVYGSGFPKSLDIAKSIDASDRIGVSRDRSLKFTAWMRTTGITADMINTATNSCMGSHYLTDKEQPAVATEEMFAHLRPLISARSIVIPDDIEELVKWRTVESENLKRRKIVGSKTMVDLSRSRPVSLAAQGLESAPNREVNLTEAHTDAAKQWEGWGTALKPAWEPICLARKPFKGTVAGNVLKHGTSALNIDASRIPFASDFDKREATEKNQHAAFESGPRDTNGIYGEDPADRVNYDANGRWPSNILHDGSAEVLAAFPDDGFANASRFFYSAKTSTLERHDGLDRYEIVSIESPSWVNEDQKVQLWVDMGQSPPRVIAAFGTPNSDASAWNTFLFGNASTDQYLTDFTSIIKTGTSSITGSKTSNWFLRWLTSASTEVANCEKESGGSHAANAENGKKRITITSAWTVSVRGVERAASPTQYEISVAGALSTHPTVKPTALMAWLVRLITPKGGRVLDPFMGSGSTGRACAMSEMSFTGIDLTAEYIPIARARINEAIGPLFSHDHAK